jgi:hypothetical protein
LEAGREIEVRFQCDVFNEFLVYSGMVSEKKIDQAAGIGCPLFDGIFTLMYRIRFNSRVALAKIVVPVLEVLFLPVLVEDYVIGKNG